MRERVTGRTQTDDQNVFSVIRQRVRTFGVQRIPARQQAINFKTVRQFKTSVKVAVSACGMLTGSCFGKCSLSYNRCRCDVRFRRTSDCQSSRARATQSNRRAFHQVHFRNFFVERAAFEFDSERIAFRRAVFFVQAFRAGIFFALVANQTIIDFVKRVAHRAAVVGQFKAVAPPHSSSRRA
jgi:hypothetical protein